MGATLTEFQQNVGSTVFGLLRCFVIFLENPVISGGPSYVFIFWGGRREEAAQQYINQVYSSELRLASQVGSIERA